MERFAEKPWSERLAKPVMKNVVRVDREFDDPLPPEAKNLDAVVNVLFYYDTVWMKTDRMRMNQAIFSALPPGGAYFIIDHSGRAGTGTTEVKTNHRIEEQVVRDEVKRPVFVWELKLTFCEIQRTAAIGTPRRAPLPTAWHQRLIRVEVRQTVNAAAGTAAAAVDHLTLRHVAQSRILC